MAMLFRFAWLPRPRNGDNEAEKIPSLAGEESVPTSLAYRQSYGFFHDITDEDWRHLQDIALSNPDHTHPGDPFYNVNDPPAWYQENWEPNFSCRFEQRIGCMGDGGKWVCDPHRIGSEDGSQCLVYSVGCRGEVDFEVELLDTLKEKNCELHIFDPAEQYAALVTRRFEGKQVYYHAWGLRGSYVPPTFENDIGLFDGIGDGENSTVDYLTLHETMINLNHTGRTVDVLKIDCEGCEWFTYRDWLDKDIRQILVETHSVPVPTANDFFRDIARAGYVMYHKEANIQFGSNCVEFGFLKLHPDFLNSSSTLN